MHDHIIHEHDHEHSHEHTHTHTHEHHHDHSHSHAEAPASKEEQLALLAYMLHHNEHHAEELHELAHGIDGEASALIHEAVALFNQGNEKLAAALSLLK